MMLKNKLDQDQMAMILADWLAGELTTCEGMTHCVKECPLNKDLKDGLTICETLGLIAEKLNEVEK